MQAPRTLGRTAAGEVCELDDPRCAYLLIGKGQTLVDHDPEAKRITAYLEQLEAAKKPEPPLRAPRPETKAVEKTEALIEDKSLKPDEAEQKSQALPHPPADEAPGIRFPPEATRGSGGKR